MPFSNAKKTEVWKPYWTPGPGPWPMKMINYVMQLYVHKYISLGYKGEEGGMWEAIMIFPTLW